MAKNPENPSQNAYINPKISTQSIPANYSIQPSKTKPGNRIWNDKTKHTLVPVQKPE